MEPKFLAEFLLDSELSASWLLEHSGRTKGFIKTFLSLPVDIQKATDRAYKAWEANHSDPSVKFQRIRGTDIWSARVSLSYRALARDLGNDNWMWYWLGTHRDYERKLRSNDTLKAGS